MAKEFRQHCPIACALDVVGERWSLLVVRELWLGPLRFGDLLTALPGIGTRVLTERLKHLVEAGVVEARELPAPVSARAYALSERGRALSGVLRALAEWGAPMLERSGGSQSPSSAALMMHARLAAAFGDDPFDVAVDIGGISFAFRRRANVHRVERAEVADADGRISGTTANVFALLEGRLELEDALRTGRLVATGRVGRSFAAAVFGTGKARTARAGGR